MKGLLKLHIYNNQIPKIQLLFCFFFSFFFYEMFVFMVVAVTADKDQTHK